MDRALLLAERGRGNRVDPDTIEAFLLALRLGATGIRTDAWTTRDGVVVLAGSRSSGTGMRRRRLRSTDLAEIDAQTPTLAAVHEALPAGTAIVLTVGDPDAVASIVEVTTARGSLDELWLCHDDLSLLKRWRDDHPDVALCARSRLRELPGGAERQAAVLRDAGIEALELPRDEWTVGLTTLCHRFGRQAWAYGATHERMVHE
ncbi:MAG TPA: hypothetical protein VJM33_12605, partial [Microthrixaceae bacterium]|nr:hypothetical protein [Microthrixaceae bacterium]